MPPKIYFCSPPPPPQSRYPGVGPVTSAKTSYGCVDGQWLAKLVYSKHLTNYLNLENYRVGKIYDLIWDVLI